eukprot:GGOE01053793.1.p1 GENE.GGOE01053793.1~~GGOE01053793.1.p1  ORF type:complete len:888 (+),score=245.95 GGOE01053793.1:60-2723(+)
MPRKLKPGNFPRYGDMHGVPPPHTWVPYPGLLFNVRVGPNYAKTGRKEPSLESLYEVFAVDMWNMPQKLPHYASQVELPPVTGPKLALPEYFIVNLMVPGYAPSLIWGGASDGEGWALVIVGRLRPAVKEALASGNLSNAMRLAAALVKSSEGSPLRKRFKIIAQVLNPDECGFSSTTASMVKKYNGKPFLVRTTSSFFSGENYFEVTVDAHNFGKPARIGLWGFKEVFSSVVFTGGFVIEGVDDDQLPEQILMAAKFSKPDRTIVPWFSTAEEVEKVPDVLVEAPDNDNDSSAGSTSSSTDEELEAEPEQIGAEPDPEPEQPSLKEGCLPPCIAMAPPRNRQSTQSLPSMLQHCSFDNPTHVAEPLGDLTDANGLPVTVDGDPIEGGMLMVSADMDYFPNRCICWFRNGVPLDGSDTTVYIPSLEDVGRRIGVSIVPFDATKEMLKPKWESDYIQPSLPELNNLQISNCFVGEDAFIKYAYFGGQEGRTRSAWLRSRNGRWEKLPAYENRNSYTCTADDVLHHIKCTLTPLRQDGVTGPTREVSEMCGISEGCRSDLIESLIEGRKEFLVQFIDGHSASSGLLGFNHKYIWVTLENGHKLHSGRFRPSCTIQGETSSEIVTVYYVDKNSDKDAKFTCRVPNHRERCQLVLCFRLYMAMAMEDLVPEFLGPEVYSDWKKGKFEEYQRELNAERKKRSAPKSKPNCHHRLRLALERSPPPLHAHAYWNGRDPFPEEAIRRLKQDEADNGVGWREARDVLVALMLFNHQPTSTVVESPTVGPPIATSSYRPAAKPTIEVPALHPLTPSMRSASSVRGQSQVAHRQLEAKVEALTTEVRELRALLTIQQTTAPAAVGSPSPQRALQTLFFLVAVIFFILGLQAPAAPGEL